MKNLWRTAKAENSFLRTLNVGKLMLLSVLTFALASCKIKDRSNKTASKDVIVPDWALPGSATHKQVPPPADFHRATVTDKTPIGIFDGQSDVGGALVPGSSSYDATAKAYTINSAGYNIWYTRDEFRFLWKKMSGDISLAADVEFPNPDGYFDRKAVVIIRKSLADDAEEVMVGLHGGGLMHLAWRPEKNKMISQMKVPERSAMRIGMEKRGDVYTMFVSLNGEPMRPLGEPIQLPFKGPFYVGIGFCSHIPDKVDTAILSNVVLENVAGKVR
ncbi:MAG TPA: hypothetical protein VFM79_07120 [Pelobium sp.]|nr:hypothetical protein [Pelobium sp.]